MDTATSAEQHDDDEGVTDDAPAPTDDAPADEAPAGNVSRETDDDEDEATDDERDTFPRPYVERLRARSAGYRTRANELEARTTELEAALFTERVRALDVLADPTDLPYDADLLDDADALREAVTELVGKRPHLRRRGVAGRETGAREHTDTTETTSLLGIMRSGA